MRQKVVTPLVSVRLVFAQLCVSAVLCLSSVQPASAKVGLLNIPTFNQVKAAYQPSTAYLLDRQGSLLHSVRLDMQAQRAPWVGLAQISPQLAYAVITAEDKNFESHSGVDWSALASATWDNAWGAFTRQRARGASTLTMQLIGLIDESQVKAGKRSILEKVSQSTLALSLERSWTKQQILEAYLNLASFKGELVGVGAMSNGLFGKAPEGLNTIESAIAAVLLRSPNAKSNTVAKRACVLLKNLQAPSPCEQVSALVEAAFVNPSKESQRWILPATASATQGRAANLATQVSPQLAPHAANKLLDKSTLLVPGQGFQSSLFLPLQNFAQQSLRQQLTQLTLKNVEDGAVLVLDNATGEVLAWVGSSGDFSQARQVDGVTSLRQAGSTLKPFLYALAFEKKYLNPAALIEDAPYTLDTGNGLYAPQNYESDYKGWVSVRSALGNSLNIPAVKTVVQTGVEPFYQQLRQLGFSSLTQSADWYGYSLSLGSADVSLMMLTNAYRSLANGGEWSPLRVTPTEVNRNAKAKNNDSLGNPQSMAQCVTEWCRSNGRGTGTGAVAAPGDENQKSRRVISPQASFMVSDILSDRSARALTFGLESWLSTPYWTAVKTGTSKDMRDNWCIGFSSRYTVGVWVGNASGQPMHDVSGVTGAAPVWREVMDWLHRGSNMQGRSAVPSQAPKAPLGLEQHKIRFEPRIEPPRREWFMNASKSGSSSSSVSGSMSEPKGDIQVIELIKRPVLARIQYPAQGTVLALDADIPPNRQRIQFSAGGPIQKGWGWNLNGKALAPSAIPHGWLPLPGRHRLQLMDDKGKQVDEVQFTVRPLKAGRS